MPKYKKVAKCSDGTTLVIAAFSKESSARNFSDKVGGTVSDNTQKPDAKAKFEVSFFKK